MPAKVRVTTVMVLFILTFVLLQGCGSSSSDNTPSVGQSLNLSLTSTGGANTLVTNSGNALQLQMAVTTADGHAVANTPVAFSTDLGLLSPVAGTNVISSTATHATAVTRQTEAGNTITVATDSNGLALIQLHSGGAVGTATISAEVEGYRQTFAVNFISGVPANVAVTVTPSTVGVGQTASIVATVTDSNGAPVSGIAVAFSLSTNNSGSALSALTGTTDGNGQAMITYRAGAVTGNDTIQVNITADASGTTAGFTESANITVQQESNSASSLELLVSSPQINSDGSETITLTGLVRDDKNNFIQDTTVSFAADSGGIEVVNDTTDSTGRATARLSTAGDPTNRIITVTAFAGSLLSTNTVTVNGTTVTISGASALTLGGRIDLSILLQDSGGKGIKDEVVAIASALGNALSAAEVTTDFNGQATVTVTATTGGVDTIAATALGASGETKLSVSSDDFHITAPAPDTEIQLGQNEPITLQWTNSGVPQANKVINFFATRGILSKTQATTDANGEIDLSAMIEVTSATVGPAIITAEADEDGGPSTQVEVEFVADPSKARALILQASPTSLGVNPVGTADQQSIITAVVRDENDNLVKNLQVSFTLTDITGGSIFPASAVTDSFGRASTVYTAGSTTSSQDGVQIDAIVVGTPTTCDPTQTNPTGPCDRVNLTVAQQSLFIQLGTSHLIESASATQYAKPYSVLVSDANSNPVADARVELNVYPTFYQKGVYIQVIPDAGSCFWAKSVAAQCRNEDLDRNGIMDPGEDVSQNSTLDPGNVVAVPTSVTTDQNGFALFNLTYAKEFTWVEVILEARAVVGGSEAINIAQFFLPGLAADFIDCEISPPGQTSKFGIATSCSCDERIDPTCPLP